MADAFEPLLAAASNTTSAITAPILEELGNEVDLATCRLLGPFALAIQGVMGAAVLGSLVAKRMREQPRRKWKIWLADVSKQVIGQAFVHASNVAISDLIAMHTSNNPCALYALNIITDTTLGVLILYWLLHFSTRLMRQYAQPLYETGYYGSPFSLSLWGEQAAVYVACLTAMKIVVLVLFWLFPFLEDIMSWTLSWITNEEAQVFVVMLVIPLFMNLFQFLMIDSFLKSKEPHTPVIGADTDEEAQRRGFLEDAGDEDGDESFDDRPMREVRAGGGERRGYTGLGTLDGGEEDGDANRHDGSADDDDKYRTKERFHAAREEASPLFDADFEAGEALGVLSETSKRPAPHSYPPPHSSRAAPPAVPNNLPAYTPPHVSQSRETGEGWDAEWSGSEATHSRPSSPALVVSGSAVPSTSPETAGPDASEAPTPLSVATASGRADAASLQPAASTWPARPGDSSPDGADVEHEWSFGHDEGGAKATLATPPCADTSPPRLVLADADDTLAPSSSLAIGTGPLASFGYTPSPAPESDDWGLDLEESGLAEEPAAGSDQIPESPRVEVSANGSRTADPGRAGNVADPDHQDPAAQASDDEWGFQEEELTAADDNALAPPTHLPTPDDKTEPVDAILPVAGDTHSSSPPHAAVAAAEHDDDLDDWGFRDSQDDDPQR
ncbi:hypothetical protein JCM3774_000039 [Rhodotorula dairenensis]